MSKEETLTRFNTFNENFTLKLANKPNLEDFDKMSVRIDQLNDLVFFHSD